VSLVLAAKNEGENLVDTVECVLSNSGPWLLEVVVVDDGSTDGGGDRVRACFSNCPEVTIVATAGLGIAQARNLGAARASGEILVFMDAHCYTPKGWLEGLAAPLDDPGVGLVGPAFASLGDVDGPRGYGAMWRKDSLEMDWLPCKGEMPYCVPLHPGGCHVVRRSDFEALGGYDGGMSRWGSEGEELSIRYWLMGFEVVVQPQVVIHHLFRKRHPYRVQSLRVYYNQLRMALLHLGNERVGRLLDRFRSMPDFSQIFLWLMESDVMQRRKRFQAQRQRDDEWFFARFPGSSYRPLEVQLPEPQALKYAQQ
jgi:glycosyltransferase involved in cell wall biosynthesis